MEGCGAGYIGCTSSLSQTAGIKVSVNSTIRSCGGLLVGRSHRRSLTTSHTIDTVVKEYHSKINITTAAVNEVIATNCSAVTITGYDDNIKLRICQLNTSGKRNSTAMSCMESVKIHIAGSSGGAADTGNYNCFILVQTLLFNGLNNSLHNDTVTTAWTPEVWQAILTKIFFKRSFHYALPPATSSSIPASISAGSKIVMSYFAQSSTGHLPATTRSTSPTSWP